MTSASSSSLLSSPSPAPAPASSVGWLEVICGPMFSGKTEALIERLRAAGRAGLEVVVFRPAADRRSRADAICSHSGQVLEAQVVADAAAVARLVGPSHGVVGIDEVQFFDAGIVAVAERLADEGRRVILAGLDQDYTGAPFGPVPALLARAEVVAKLAAVCAACGRVAGRTQRLVAWGGQIVVGAQEAYQPRCRRCHSRPDAREP